VRVEGSSRATWPVPFWVSPSKTVPSLSTADIASVLPRQKLARIAQPGQPGLKAEVKRRHCCSSSWSSPLPRNDSSQGPGRWRGILSALGGLSGLHILPVGLVASKMSFNLFIKRSNPAAQSLSIALNLLHVVVGELVGNAVVGWLLFLCRHNAWASVSLTPGGGGSSG